MAIIEIIFTKEFCSTVQRFLALPEEDQSAILEAMENHPDAQPKSNDKAQADSRR